MKDLKEQLQNDPMTMKKVTRSTETWIYEAKATVFIMESPSSCFKYARKVGLNEFVPGAQNSLTKIKNKQCKRPEKLRCSDYILHHVHEAAHKTL
ncbi:hypothetical protein C0J52_22414 [Blattella germanica]|nr:hypothetical protein C0J52_22414 [Blattella germanica]